MTMARPTAARPDAIRQHNLRLLLSEIHQRGETSRADLTQRLGLNRSTIGALVADLVDQGLVSEWVPDTRSGAGRPSHVVGPRDDGPYAVAVDVDVHSVVVAAVGLGGHILGRCERDLPEGVLPEYVVSVVTQAYDGVRALLPDGAWPVGVGVSVPGTVRRSDGRVVLAPNLHWRDVDLRGLVAKAFDTTLPVYIGNDADVGALAEHLRGNGRGVDNLLYLNCRVGVGGGIIVDGLQLHGAGGLAGEIGHMLVDPLGPDCYCGNRGCFETLVGEPALIRLAGMTVPPGHDAIEDILVAEAAGDPQARTAIEAVAEWLGRGLASLANILNPSVIIIGGSLTAVADTHRALIRQSLDRYAMGGTGDTIELRLPGLGDDSALLGAAELAFAGLLAAPLETVLNHGPMRRLTSR